MKNKIFAFILACLTFWIYPALSKEVIKSFDSLLQVQKDGSIIVTETIVVHHEGKNIRRGIYRDLPTANGERYELLDVKRNFNAEPSFVEKGKKYFRINTGDNSFLPHPGRSTFEIKYKVWNVPTSFDGYDEVYWNVTGDRWAFPIEKVSARVELPENATIMQQASYIGHTGSKNHATYNGDGKFTGKHLSPGEQLTIAVGFTPEIVSTQKKWNTVDWLLRIIPCCFIIYLLFLLWVWNLKGRDPFKRAIMPQFDPPEKLTAVQAGALYNEYIPSNLLTISFTQMISTGFLKVTTLKRKGLFSETKKYILEKTGKPSSNIEEDLTLWERKILKGYQDGSLIAEENRLRRVTEKRMQSYYKKNTLWVSIPTFIMLYPIIMTMFFHFFPADPYIFPAFLSLLITPIISKRYNRILWENIVSSFILLLFISPLILVPLFSEGGGIAALLLTVYFLATALTASVFGFLVYQPSVEGQRLIEHLEGLYLFLKTVKSPFEDQRKIEDILDEKKMEDILPYAMALGLEEEWKNKFKKLFGLEAYNTFRHSHPYMSRDFTRSFHSVTSSSHSSGHHSGSGGGGFSGGGFGGGGGGGR